MRLIDAIRKCCETASQLQMGFIRKCIRGYVRELAMRLGHFDGGHHLEISFIDKRQIYALCSRDVPHRWVIARLA